MCINASYICVALLHEIVLWFAMITNGISHVFIFISIAIYIGNQILSSMHHWW